jgi:hypothetical protein
MNQMPQEGGPLASGQASSAPGPRVVNQVPGDLPVVQFNKLPQHIKELLVMKSVEPNLARVSCVVLKDVSTNEIFKIFLLYALFDNDQEYPVRISRFNEGGYQHLTKDQRLALQRDVLGCRWCTYSHIKKCLPDLMHLVLARKWEMHRQAQDLADQSDESDQIEPSVDDLERGPLPNDFNDIEALKRYFQSDHSHAQEDTICTKIAYTHGSAVIFEYIPRRALAPRIWDKDDVDYLLFIR